MKSFYDGCFKILVKGVSGPGDEEASPVELLIVAEALWILPPFASYLL